MFQVSNHVHRTYTKNFMWQVSDVSIEAGSLIQAGGGSRAFVLIEARGLVLEVLRYMLVFFVSCCLGFFVL